MVAYTNTARNEASKFVRDLQKSCLLEEIQCVGVCMFLCSFTFLCVCVCVDVFLYVCFCMFYVREECFLCISISSCVCFIV